MCGIFEGFNEDMIDHSDIVDVGPLRFNVCYVFKPNLTDDQIRLLKECIPDVVSNDRNSRSSRRFFLSGDYDGLPDIEDIENILDELIPWELANLLSHITYSSDCQPSILFFQSDSLLRRARLINLVNSQFHRYPSRDVEYRLMDIVNPFHFTAIIQKIFLDIFTAEMIASHFFFNPKVINTMDNSKNDFYKGLLIDRSSRIERDRDKILRAYSIAKRFLTLDISQKVRMYNSPEEKPSIDNWLEGSIRKVHEIVVREEPNECDHRIYCIVQYYWDDKTYELQRNILAFV